MATFMSRILPAGALAVIMVGLFVGPEAQAIKDLTPVPARAGALTGLEDAAKGGVAELCMAPPVEAYSHVGIADEVVRPFASCLR